MFSPGQQIADFRIERVLGEGGMGAVYVATQLSTGRSRALKVMHPKLADNASYVERFVAEARVGSRIQSEHIVEVVGAGIDASTRTPWLAMELLEGHSLDQLIAARGALPPSEVLAIFEQTCHGIAAAHQAGIIHRDLKPENVFVAKSRRVGLPFVVKILDFGIAKWTQDALFATGSQAIGTPYWMSPEQAQPRGPIGPRTDVWAFGLLAFFALTGRSYWLCAQPGAQSGVAHFLHELLMETPEPASARAARFGLGHLLTPAFDAWFVRCLAREPIQRFAMIEECMEALKSALSMPHTASTPGTMVMTPGSFAVAQSWPEPTSVSSSGAGGTTPIAVGSYPGPLPVIQEAPSRAWMFVVAAAIAFVCLLGLGGVGWLVLRDGDGDAAEPRASVGTETRPPQVEEYRNALEACENALRSFEAARALEQAQTALRARPNDAAAAGCRDRASAMQSEQGTFDRGVAALGRGAYGEAHAIFGELPASSAFRSRPEVASAAQGLGQQRLTEGQRIVRAQPAEAFLIARSVARLQGISPAQRSDASALEAQAVERSGPLVEGRVVPPSSVAAQACTISVQRSSSAGFNCRFRIRCDGRTLYGAASGGYNHCRTADGRFTQAEDENGTRRDGDPEMSFDLLAHRARVYDEATGIDVTMEIVDAPAP